MDYDMQTHSSRGLFKTCNQSFYANENIYWKLKICHDANYVVMGGTAICHSTLHWRHNGRDSVSNHQPHDCLLNCLLSGRSKKTSKFRVTGFCEGNSPVTGEFPALRARNVENVSIWWRHHVQPAEPPVKVFFLFSVSWWRHDMETLFALLALCTGKHWLTKGQQLGYLMFSLSLSRTDCWPNSRFATDLGRNSAHMAPL